MKQIKSAEQEAARFDAVFPCVIKILPTCIFNAKDPIVLGVEILEGVAKVGCWAGGLSLSLSLSLSHTHALSLHLSLSHTHTHTHPDPPLLKGSNMDGFPAP
jgi:hypothetical protein